MNDFTKEELQIIALDMSFYAKNKRFKCLVEAHSHVKCREKVESLIDNYCEHETEMDKKNKIYREHILPRFGNDPDKAPPHMEPDYNEGWR